MPRIIQKKEERKKRLANDLVPGDIFLPGSILKDEIEARNISQTELAKKMSTSKTIISDLIHGRRKITASIAVSLESALEIPAKFWANLQSEYDINQVKMLNQKRLSELKNRTLKAKAPSTKISFKNPDLLKASANSKLEIPLSGKTASSGKGRKKAS